MNLKDFEKGKTAYILSYGYGSNEDIIVECIVESVGTKYVTVSPYPYLITRKFEVNDNYDNALLEVNYNGDFDLLFKTKEDIELYKELLDLRRWFSNEVANRRSFRTYSLEQLKVVKEILEGGNKDEKIEIESNN